MERIDKIIEDLKGTCLSLDEVLSDYDLTFDDLTAEEFSKLDQEIFLCGECGWWCEMTELNEEYLGSDQICYDCFENYEI